MRINALVVIGLSLSVVLGLGACDEDEKEAGNSREGGSGPTLREQAGKLANRPAGEVIREITRGEELPEKRLPSARRLGDILVAEVAGLTRGRAVDLDETPAMKKVAANAHYCEGKYDLQTAIKVEVEWFGKRLMGTEKLGFGIYKPQKTSISGLDAVWQRMGEIQDDNHVRVRVHPQLLVKAYSKKYDVDRIRGLLEAFDLASLKAQADDGSLFTPHRVDDVVASLLEVDDLGKLLPDEIAGMEAMGSARGRRSVREQFHCTARRGYRGVGQVKMIDLGAPEFAAERYPIELEKLPGVETYRKDPSTTVDSETLSVGGQKAVVALVTRRGGGKTTTVMLRAQAGRFIIESTFVHNATKPPKGMDPAMAKQLGLGLFETPVDQARAILEALDLEALAKM